jgi:hypothetical protein
VLSTKPTDLDPIFKPANLPVFHAVARNGLKRWFEDAGFLVDWILPSSSNFYAASAFVIEAVRTDMRRCGNQNRFADFELPLKRLFDEISTLADGRPCTALRKKSPYPLAG